MRNGPLLAGLAAAFAAAGVAAPSPAHAVAQVSLAPWGGVLVLDPHLADYRWETDPRPVWGGTFAASAGRLSGGARVWRATTRQATGIPGETRQFAVSLTGVQGVGEVGLAEAFGFRLGATGSAGVVRFAWAPREMTIDDVLLGEPIVVRADPIDEAVFGAGAVLRRALPFGLEAAAAAERTWFALDTAHRRGDAIVEERETFGSWTVRMEIARPLFGL